MINQHFATVSQNKFSIANHKTIFSENGCTDKQRLNARKWISAASKTKNTPWFKNVTAMEYIGREILKPDLANPDSEFDRKIADFFSWAENNA